MQFFVEDDAKLKMLNGNDFVWNLKITIKKIKLEFNSYILLKLKFKNITFSKLNHFCLEIQEMKKKTYSNSHEYYNWTKLIEIL